MLTHVCDGDVEVWGAAWIAFFSYMYDHNHYSSHTNSGHSVLNFYIINILEKSTKILCETDYIKSKNEKWNISHGKLYPYIHNHLGLKFNILVQHLGLSMYNTCIYMYVCYIQ